MPSPSSPAHAHSLQLEIDGVALHGAWFRPAVPHRPTLVFLHDGLGCIGTWRHFPALVANGLGVGAFAFDRWGYGQSARRDAFPADFMDSEAAMLGRVLRSAGIDDGILVGHSDGGTIGLLYAASRPQGVRAAVILSAHVHGDQVASDQVDRHARMAAEGDVPDWMYRFHGDRAPALLAAWTRHWRRSFDSGWNIAEKIREISIPVLALHGAKDAYGLPGQLEAIAGAVPGVDARLLPGIGHFPHIEAPEATAALVIDYLAPLAG